MHSSGYGENRQPITISLKEADCARKKAIYRFICIEFYGIFVGALIANIQHLTLLVK
jgi:hypothetical protein